MSKYLIAISVGPVQDFIAAARRTRDLWFGSEVLSRISKSIARELDEKGAELIFPAPGNVKEDLSDNNPNFNVGNKLLVISETETPFRDVTELKKKAQLYWKNIVQQVKEDKIEIFKNGNFIDQDMWDKQLVDVLEIYCAWVKIEENSKYEYCRKRVDALLMARKNTREFNQSNVDGWGKPKSSLDGLRESVLKKSLNSWERMKLGLSNSEQLDCPGLIKRLGGLDHERFTPISRVAIDPWLRGVEVKKALELKKIGKALEPLIKHGLVSKVSGNHGIYSVFPYDAQLLYSFRLDAIKIEVKRTYQGNRDQCQKVLSLIETVKKLIKDSGLKAYGDPSPYVAIIHADGDRMGELLDSKKTKQEHRRVSSQLAEFSAKVSEIVRDCRGDTIYSGGDDVLALLPLDKVIECSYRLQDKFKSLVNPASEIEATLSVGIAVGHILEPMSKLLNLSRRAEKLAKGNKLEKEDQRNALAILLKPRSGALIEIRGRWNKQPQLFLKHWITAHVNNEIPDGAAYQLRQLAQDLNWVDETNEKENQLLNLEALRILKRKKSKSGKEDLSQQMINLIEERIKEVGVKGVAEELILTRRFAEVEMQAKVVQSKEMSHA